MCPVVLLALLLSFLMMLMEISAAITVNFSPSGWRKFKEGESRTVYFSLNDTTESYSNDSVYKAISEDPYVADTSNMTVYMANEKGTFNGSFVVRGNFLGITKLKIVKEEHGKIVSTSNELETRILKVKQVITKIFAYSVIVLVSLNYINMGCAMDLGVVKSVLKKPIAPCVGFFSQYLIMPLVAYCVARLLFKDYVLQLGLFTFGCSPGGGASNMWTVLLRGNLNLSLTMTFISGFFALGMMPLWLFTLGRTLFSEIKVSVPYHRILLPLAIMLVMLGVGVSFQKYLPRVAKFCRRILAPVSIGMIIFIIVFGTYANFYMFKLFSWQIVLAATINVWLGFLLGAIAARLFRFPLEDIIAIAVETGVQHTGIAFVLLNFALPEPENHIAAVVPVAGSIMTPIPLFFIYCVQKVRNRFDKKSPVRNMYSMSDDEDEEKRALPTPSSAESINGSKTNGYVY